MMKNCSGGALAAADPPWLTRPRRSLLDEAPMLALI